jgi:hypothetical protein
VPIVWKPGSLSLLEPSGPVEGLHRDCITFAMEVTVFSVSAYSNYIVFLHFTGVTFLSILRKL